MGRGGGGKCTGKYNDTKRLLRSQKRRHCDNKTFKKLKIWGKLKKYLEQNIQNKRPQDSYVCPDQSRGNRTKKLMFYFQNLFNFWGKRT